MNNFIMESKNPVMEYKFTWKVENPSTIKQLRSIQGPKFYIPCIKDAFSFLLQFDFCSGLYMLKASLKHDLNETTRTYLLKIQSFLMYNDGQILGSDPSPNYDFMKNCNSCVCIKGSMDYFNNRLNAQPEILLCGLISITNYNSTSCLVPLQNSSKPWNNKKLSEDLKLLYRSEMESNFTCLVDGKKFLVHKNIICARSPVFLRMLKHDMDEKKMKTIVIKDVESKVFDLFLVFLYSGEVDKDEAIETLLSLYSLADKYEVLDLQLRCSQLIQYSMAVETVCKVLKLAFLHSDNELKQAAKCFIFNHFTKTLKTTGWSDILATYPTLASEVMKEASQSASPTSLFENKKA